MKKLIKRIIVAAFVLSPAVIPCFPIDGKVSRSDRPQKHSTSHGMPAQSTNAPTRGAAILDGCRQNDKRHDHNHDYENENDYSSGYGYLPSFEFADQPQIVIGNSVDLGYSDGFISGKQDLIQGNLYNPRQYERSGDPDYFEGFVAGYQDGYRH